MSNVTFHPTSGAFPRQGDEPGALGVGLEGESGDGKDREAMAYPCVLCRDKSPWSSGDTSWQSLKPLAAGKEPASHRGFAASLSRERPSLQEYACGPSTRALSAFAVAGSGCE